MSTSARAARSRRVAVSIALVSSLLGAVGCGRSAAVQAVGPLPLRRVEAPAWRLSYRLVFDGDAARLETWGAVQNASNEDWSDVHLSLVAGARSSASAAETMLADGEQPGDCAEASDVFGMRPYSAIGPGWGGGGTGEGFIGMGNIGSTGRDAEREEPARVDPSPVVRVDPTIAAGGVDPGGIRRVLMGRYGQIYQCYERLLATRPSLGGRVVARFVIGERGTVLGASAGGDAAGAPDLGQCVVAAVRGLQFPRAEGGGTATVSQPFTFTAPYGGVGRTPPTPDACDPPAPSPAPRVVSSTAAQGDVTRYEPPDAVTVPAHGATTVLLAARAVPGSQVYLFAPNPRVRGSGEHPFRAARFENRTGALLERGPVAIFAAGARLGRGMLDALPDAAIATVPFALERAITVGSWSTSAVEGARLLTMLRGSLTIERFAVWRTTYRVSNDSERAARVMMRQALGESPLYEPPAGTEQSDGHALIPLEVAARGSGEVVVTTRTAVVVGSELGEAAARTAVERYLREGSPAAGVARALRTALDLQRRMDALGRERSEVEQRLDDLRARLAETVRSIDVDVSRVAPAPNP